MIQNAKFKIDSGLAANIKEAIESTPSWFWRTIYVLFYIAARAGMILLIVAAASLVVLIAGGALMSLGAVAGTGGLIPFCLVLFAIIIFLKFFLKNKNGAN